MEIKQTEDIEEALRDMEELNQTILDNSFNAIISMNDSGEIISWNKGAESIFGWEANEIIGKKMPDTIIPPQGRGVYANGWESFLTTERNRVLGQMLELKALHRKGYEFPIEISLSATRWEKSFIITGIIQALSVGKAAEEFAQLKTEDYKVLHDVAKALHNPKDMESMLKNSVEAITKFSERDTAFNAGIFLAEGDRKILRLFTSIGDFHQEFLAREKGTPYGDCLNVIHDSAEKITANAACFIDPSREQDFQSMPERGSYIIPLRKNDNLIGILFIYEDHGAPWHERNKEILLSIGGLIADAIEQRRSDEKIQKQNAKLVEFNEKLEKLNESKNKLLSIAAHDLRNPLYVIQSYSDTLKDSSLIISDENKQKYLEKIFNSSEQMRNLLDNLLDFSSIESGELHLNKSSQCLNSIVANQVELHQLLAKKKDIRLIFSPQSIPPLMLDKNAMIQAIGNFIGNAIKFSPHGRLVKISTECEEAVVRFSVNDEGPGLTEEELKLVFTEFQTLTPKPTGGEKSTGLGLSIVKKIITLHGGEVGVTSGAGKGANFYFTVPLY